MNVFLKYLSVVVTMSSVQGFRDFICERLTAAALEIFTAYEQTVAQYELEISRQRKLLDNNWTSPIEAHRSETEKPGGQDVEVLSEQRLSNDERSCSVDRDEPEFTYIKEEPDDQGSDQEEQQPSLKLETDNNPSIPSSSISVYPVEDHEVDTDNFMRTTEEEQNGSDQEFDNGQVPFHNTPAAHIQNQTKSEHMDSTSSPDAAVRPNRRRCRNVVSVAPVSESQSDIKPRRKARRRNVNGKAGMGRRKRPGRIHTDEKPCCCKACGKSFRDNYTLSVHMRTHTGEKPYACNMCGKCYRNRHGLVNHMRNHTGEKPYVCKTCGKSYKHSSGLSYHMRSHANEAIYSCRICGENFREHCDLLVHMNTHKAKALYSCKDCGKKFRQSHDLFTHMRSHTGENLYPCPQCDKSFRLSRYLIVHMRTHQ